MRKRFKVLYKTISLVLFLSTALFSQNSNPGIFTRIGINQGLATGNVNDIIQDSLGFIWLATESGLCRYDGYKFVLFQHQTNDTSSISYNHVFSLLEGENGIIWVGTLGGGLNKFDSKTEKFLRYTHDEFDTNSISNNNVYKVFEDSENTIWISTLGGGLNKFDKEFGKFKNFKHSQTDPTSISSNMVSDIYEDNKGRLWLGTYDKGLNLFNKKDGSFRHFVNDKDDIFSINNNQVMDILQYSDDELLIATFGGGVNLFNTKRRTFLNESNSKDFKFDIDHKNVRKLFNDGQNIWIGTYNGLFKFDLTSEKILKYSYSHNRLSSIDNNKIRGIFKDKSGVLWFGTTQGVNLLKPNRKNFEYTNYKDYNQDFIEKKKPLLIPKIEGVIWPHLKNSEREYSHKIIKYFGISFNPNINSFTTFINFYYDENNILWMSDYNGLKYYDSSERTFKYIEYFAKGKNDFVKSFFIDSKGNFWAGTLGGGLTYYNKETKILRKFIHSENDKTTICDSRVIPIMEDSNGIIWIGTYGGLNSFDPETEKFTSYMHEQNDNSSISNNRIYSIIESKNGDLWIGTYQGLNRYLRNENGFECFNSKNGFAGNSMYGILEDNNENLWIRTNEGISKFDPLKDEIKNYNTTDGLVEIESNLNICFKTNNGKMNFSGLNGFNIFDPEEIKDNTAIPQVVFTELRILDSLIKVGDPNYLQKSLNDIDELTLSYKDKIFSIEFAALHYVNPTKNKYAYMLEGFRNQWTFLEGNNRKATFTNLSAGDYVLHVKTSNNDGIWNETGRSLKIIVTPPYWETFWFRILVFIFILFIIFIAYEYRFQKIVAIERTRARIARNLHDDVGGTIAGIQYFINAIRKSSSEDEKDKFLNLIMASSNDAQEKIRDIIWTVNPKEDKLSKFFVRFNRYASDIFDSNNITYSIKFPKVDSEKELSMEKRQHLWCICKETVINSVKHSMCSHVNINFDLNDNTLLYSIEDDGIGFNKSKQTQGNGLTNISFRAEKLGAKCDVITEKNEGVKINFYLHV